MKRIILFILTQWFMVLASRAQSYSIDWYKISGGGGTSTNGQYAVTGTIGQPDASGAMTGGNYSLAGGFWSLIAVAQTAGAPTLYISHSGNTVTVYWQEVSGWTLQQNNNLTAPANWSANGGSTANGTNYQYLSANGQFVLPPGQSLKRWKQPETGSGPSAGYTLPSPHPIG